MKKLLMAIVAGSMMVAAACGAGVDAGDETTQEIVSDDTKEDSSKGEDDPSTLAGTYDTCSSAVCVCRDGTTHYLGGASAGSRVFYRNACFAACGGRDPKSFTCK